MSTTDPTKGPKDPGIKTAIWRFSNETLGEHEGEVTYLVYEDAVYLAFPHPIEDNDHLLQLRYESSIQSICGEMRITLQDRKIIVWDSWKPISFYEVVTKGGRLVYNLHVTNLWGRIVVTSRNPVRFPVAHEVLAAFEQHFSTATSRT